MFDQISTHGRIHGLFGAVFFSLAPCELSRLRRQFRSNPAWGALASWAAIVVAGMSIRV